MTVRDPIHGAIEFRDSEIEGGSVMGAVAQPMIKRLRQIKQNPFASYAFLGADHTRYAHALGTMQTIRKILHHLRKRKSDCQGAASIKKIAAKFPDAFKTKRHDGQKAVLFRHMVFAGLLQDVGELPYQFVTKEFFRLKRDDQENVSLHVGFDVGLVRQKDAFTLATIFADENKGALSGLDQRLLAYLIARPSIEDREDPRPRVLAPFLRMLEGEVDGDRLDYVFRDAYHTIGANGSPDAVIATVLDYDSKGPVLTDPGPVTAFFTLRASLWQQVYFHPRVRFRIALLFEVVKGIHEQKVEGRTNQRAYKKMVEHNLTFHLTPQEFGGFTDQKLWEILTSIHDNSVAKASLNGRAQRALALLLEEYDSYVGVWLPKPTDPKDVEGGGVDVPLNLFWDAYGTVVEHRLYAAGSVRISGPEWASFEADSRALEDCGGPFADLFRSGGHTQPLPGAIQVFRPPDSERTGAAWKSVETAWSTGGLYNALKSLAEANKVGPLGDTWEREGFSGPKVCISFTTADRAYVDLVVRILHDERRRYRLLRENDGLGTSAEDNSRALVQQSDAALVILSTEYAKAYENKGGNVHAEVTEMMLKVRSTAGTYRVQFVALDSWSHIENALPYKDLGGEVFLGSSLKKARFKDFEERIAALWETWGSLT